MSEHSGPPHDQDCPCRHTPDARCRCARGVWLDVTVPRWQARAELLQQFEGWAREQRIFDAADLDKVEHAMVRDHVWDQARAGVRAASSVTRGVYERMAVRALHMRRECERRQLDTQARLIPSEVGEERAVVDVHLPPLPGDDAEEQPSLFDEVAL